MIKKIPDLNWESNKGADGPEARTITTWPIGWKICWIGQNVIPVYYTMGINANSSLLSA